MQKESDEIWEYYKKHGEVPDGVDLEYVERVISFLDEQIKNEKSKSTNDLPDPQDKLLLVEGEFEPIEEIED